MKKLIGMTGPTGAGKSTAAALAREAGIQVIDCDRLAREAVLPGTAGLRALTDAFGEKILSPDGTLDRKKLAADAFSSSERTALLNRTLLPHIAALVRERIGTECVLLDAPTLFESGLDSICDTTLAVLAGRGVRLARIRARDGLTAGEAELRVSAGKPDDFYRSGADYTVYNNGDEAAFAAEIRSLFNKILEEK